MLFGRCTVCCYAVVLLLATSFIAADELKESYREGVEFSSSLTGEALKQVQVISEESVSEGETFDSVQAKKSLLSGEKQSTELSSFIESGEHLSNLERAAIGEGEDYFERSEDVSQDPLQALEQVVVEEGVTYELERCKQSGESFPHEVVRTLEVQVNHTPEVIEIKRKCQGHRFDQTFRRNKSAEKKYRELESELSSDKDIDWWGVAIKGKRVTADWRHHNNVDSCDLYSETKTLVQEEIWEESDLWHWEGLTESEAESPDTNLVAHECIEPEESREINGRSVYRKCWKDRLLFVVTPESLNECLSLKGRRCSLIERKCLKETPHGCLLWENTYRCFKEGRNHLHSLEGDQIFGLDGRIDPPEEEPNTSFAHAATTLTVFSEIEKELEENGGNAMEACLFTPQLKQCKKAIGGNLVYDCCHSMKGLANDLYLSKCNAEEKALAAMRGEGLCHYIGSYDNKTLFVKTSTTHVYACFGSKLSRVLQEQARKQLGISWGSPKSPNLTPLSAEQIAQLDLTQMDFSELLDDQWSAVGADFMERLRKIKMSKESIQTKMEGA